jgi:predicted amidohydrolase
MITRMGIVQWEMRAYEHTDILLEQMEYQVRTLAGYGCDLLLFPEYFSAPLMALAPEGLGDGERVLFWADTNETVLRASAAWASKYQVNLVLGSMPVLVEGTLRNRSYFFGRQQNSHQECPAIPYQEYQDKLHITPYEREEWNLIGGTQLTTFDSDAGTLGILICYDIEFPELARLMSEQAVDILLVPFWTDTQSGYHRVRFCAQARAIENECFVVMAGSVGAHYGLDALNLQYARSVVFSPCDFGFPPHGVVAEAETGIATQLICDLDLELLKRVRSSGSVTNSKDRRRDLYRLTWASNG